MNKTLISGGVRFFVALTSSIFIASPSFGSLKKEEILYKQDKAQLKGVLVYDESVKGPRPGVIVVHNWMGITDETMSKAEDLARLGYAAFIADIYGDGVKPSNVTEAGQLAGKFKGDRNLLRARAKAAHSALTKNSLVDKKKIAAAGYCFGGTTVLEMARAGLPLAGVISFHGGLDNPTPQDAKKIKSKVLVLHGAIDPYVSKAEVDQFLTEMNEAKVDYQFIAYGGAVHSFSEKAAGNDISKGAAYNESADKRSKEAMKSFLAEIF